MAGIIGAADNGAGVVGVLPGVKLVSIALGDSNSSSNTCSNGSPIASFVQGLELIYQRAIYDQKVAVVNISFNSVSGDFSSTGTIGLKMKAVATSSFYDGAGYRGALIVQSAGNNNLDACSFSYGPAGFTDGIMVVGGIDANGQRVVPVLGPNAYFNLPLAGDEPGSNEGNCVEVWAPSQRVYSTWSGGYQFLSGTSMAAPHIAGFAARLVESNPSIQTSDQLETAVRGYFATITGATNLSMPRMSLESVNARPTLEMVEGTTRSSLSPINFSKLAAQVNLQFEAIGAQYCNVNVTKNGAAHLNYNTSPSHNLDVQAYSPGQYIWTVTCYSPQGTQTTVVANGQLMVRAVTVSWLARTTSTGFGYPWPVIPNGGSVSWLVDTVNPHPFDQAHYATEADYCHIKSSGFTGNTLNDPNHPSFDSNATPTFSQTLLWDSGPYAPTYYQYATFYFGYATPYEGYKWLMTCRNSEGDVKSTVMYGRPQ